MKFTCLLMFALCFIGCETGRHQAFCIANCKDVLERSESAYVECVRACSTIEKKKEKK
jgi:hypothetical protein